MKNQIYDVLIVGAGPAGCACAAWLAEAGWAVAVVERAAPGRPRVCGGFLGPEFKPTVKAWGWGGDLDRLPKAPVRHVQVSGSRPRLAQTGLPRNGFAVDRGIFDRWLVDLAVRRGVRVWIEATAGGLGRADGLWTARVRSNDGREEQVIRASHWVNATGRRPAPAGKGDGNAFFACKAVYRGGKGFGDSVSLHFVERGHVGLNPLNADEATLCLCVDGRYLREAKGDLDGMMDRFMSANPNLRGQLEGAQRASAWQTCQAEPDGHPVFFKDEQFFIGDALSMVNPVIGGGIPIAMRSGVLLASFLLKGKREGDTEALTAADFEHEWKRIFAGKFAFGKMLGKTERSPAAARLAIGLLTAAPKFLPHLVRMSRPAPAR